MAETVVRFTNVTVRRHTETRSRELLLDGVDWHVRDGERWAVLGPNGAGKTTLLRLAAAQLHPSSGTVAVLGGTLGRVRIPALRPRIAFAARGEVLRFFWGYTVRDVVLTGVTGTAALIRSEVDDGHRARAAALLAELGIDQLAERPFAGCSEGERARTLIARALVNDAELVILDEPAVGLDLPGRELLVQALGVVSGAGRMRALAVATHHLEELPPSITHALLLREGRVVAAGPLSEALTDETATRCFGLPLVVETRAGRLFARAA